ncbi:hypothetical protein ACPOL_3659 [Acidisarcina polymorpha]|uniref:Uncharacterized protein n=1 Tax=Acidisarcina polymorpha TaxID=2211140 RepID=A0A2Z5G1J7_9BACT|nr:hypothetical protein ACPOL_3659 [Acidisarcina polymorpha]
MDGASKDIFREFGAMNLLVSYETAPELSLSLMMPAKLEP